MPYSQRKNTTPPCAAQAAAQKPPRRAVNTPSLLLAGAIVAVFAGGLAMTVSLLDAGPKAQSAKAKSTPPVSEERRTDPAAGAAAPSPARLDGPAPAPAAVDEAPDAQLDTALASDDAMTLARLAAHDPSARQTLLEMLRDANAETRTRALDAVEALGDPALIDHVLPLLTDDVSVRRMALGTLGELATKGKDPGVTQKVGEQVKGLVNDADPTVRNEAIAVLGDLKDKTALPQMIHALGDADLAVRGMTLTSLAKLGDPAALPHVRQVYEQGDPRLAADAAMVMKRLGDEGPWLKESARLALAIQSDDAGTRAEALRDLSRVSEMD
jgi:hypothetical protein